MYYFAYGSNMTIKRLIERGLKPTATVGVGYIDHWRIRFNKKSYKNPDIGFANIEPFWGDRVYGVIFGVREDDIVKLDKFEGYPKHYQRTLLPITWQSGSELVTYNCVTYIADRKWTTSKPLLVTEDYQKYIDMGMREHLSKVPFANTYMSSVYALMESHND